MKSLIVYINEKIKDLPDSVKGLIVFDIDDTILKVDPSLMGVYKKEPGKQEIRLTTDEFAKDKDAEDPNKKSWFDYRDFRDPVKVYNSIISGTPLIKNLKIMDDYIKAGYDFCFLTARGCEDVIKKAIGDFLKFRDKDGALKELGDSFKKTFSHAVNDEIKTYPGKTDAEKKGNVLKKLCKEYDRVVFVDDDKKNINAARELNIKNLKVIKAWED
jgi:phosphoglycolate phosphatase-like HAD superfamily hydrolase